MPNGKHHPLVSILGTAAAIVVLYVVVVRETGFDNNKELPSAPEPATLTAAPPTQAPVDEQEVLKASLAAACRADLGDKKRNYKQLMAAGKYWDAAQSIDGCHNLLEDDELKKLVRDGEVKAFVKAATDQKASAEERILAIEGFIRSYPAEAASYEKLLPALKIRVEQEAIANERRRATADALRRKREGVVLGMSKEEVIASSWGRPREINRSHGSWGVHEQWVYGGGYLYFENGKLTSVQN